MRTTEAFILGTITGAVVIGLWGRTIEDYVGEKTRGVRARTAAGLRAVEEKAGKMLDQSGSTMRRAEEFLQNTKEHVADALQAGQKAIDPASTSGTV
jgi:hypothetical protein